MSFLDRLRPKWQHSNPAIREQAIHGIRDQEILTRIACDDAAESVRLAAILKLTDQALLARIACGSDGLAVPAAKRVTDANQITTIAFNASLSEARRLAVDQITDNVALHRIATSDIDPWIRARARNKRLGPDAKRDFIRGELVKLRLAEQTARDVGEICGSLEDICEHLAGEGPFRINGGIDQNRETNPLDEGRVNSDRAQFLASRQEALNQAATEPGVNVYYEIIVWRSENNTYEFRKEEKRLAVTPDSSRWSQVSNGETNESPPAQSQVTR